MTRRSTSSNQGTDLIVKSSEIRHDWLVWHAPKMPGAGEVVIRRAPVPFSGRNRVSVMGKSWTLSSLVNYVFLWHLLFLTQLIPDASPYVSGKSKKLGNSSFLNGGCLKLAKTRFPPRLYAAPMGVSAEKRWCPCELQLCQFSKGK